MKGTKHYKLYKSTEILTITIQQEFETLRVSLTSNVSKFSWLIGEILLSTVLTSLITSNEKAMAAIPPELDHLAKLTSLVNNRDLAVLVKTIISCILIFSIAFLTLWGLGRLINIIRYKIRDPKEKPADREALRHLFYQKILNQITTAISLDKKSCELDSFILSQHTNEQACPTETALLDLPKGDDADVHDDSELSECAATDEDSCDIHTDSYHCSSLSKLYRMEALYYFAEAKRSMEDAKMFEINNSKRKEYTEFLLLLNPDLVRHIFRTCIEILSRMRKDLPNNKSEIEKLLDYYNSALRYINKQLEDDKQS